MYKEPHLNKDGIKALRGALNADFGKDPRKQKAAKARAEKQKANKAKK